MAGLSKRERISSAKEIAALFRHGKAVRGKLATLIWQPAPTRRVAVTSQRSSGGAVARNRIKRRLREAYRRQKENFPDRRSYLLVGRPAVLSCSMDLLQNELANMAMKVGRRGEASA